MFKLHVQEPWFTHLVNGKKTVEGRLAKPKFLSLAPTHLVWVNQWLCCKVVGVLHYPSFVAMLSDQGIESILPGIATLEDGVKVYRQFYQEDEERRYGVIAIVLERRFCV